MRVLSLFQYMRSRVTVRKRIQFICMYHRKKKKGMRKRGLEPLRGKPHYHLKVARIPIPPLSHMENTEHITFVLLWAIYFLCIAPIQQPGTLLYRQI